MTVHERGVSVQGSTEVASSQSQTVCGCSMLVRKRLAKVASPLAPSLHEPVPPHGPPPPLLDEQWNLQFYVERLLKRIRHKNQYQYLVKWRGYPESENSWEFKVPLRQNFP